MIMFRLLYEAMGESDFNRCIGLYYAQYHAQGGTTDQFVETAQMVSAANLSRLFDDWLYSTKYTELVRSGLTFEEMSKLYIPR